MNQFLNVFEEYALEIFFRLRQFNGAPGFLGDREKAISELKRFDINKRITLRGELEQFQNQFLSNYYGSKRRNSQPIFNHFIP